MSDATQPRVGYRTISLDWLSAASRLPSAIRALALVVIGLRYVDTEQGWHGSYGELRTVTDTRLGNARIRRHLETLEGAGLIEFSGTPRLRIRLIDAGTERTRSGTERTRSGTMSPRSGHATTGDGEDSIGDNESPHWGLRGLGPGTERTRSDNPDDLSDDLIDTDHGHKRSIGPLPEVFEGSGLRRREMTTEEAQRYLEIKRAESHERLAMPRAISPEEDIW